MTLSDILQDIYDRLNYSDAPPAKVVRRLKGFINQRHRQILTMPSVSQLRDDTITFSTVAGQAVYSLPPVVGKINGIYDAVTWGPLDKRSLAWLRETTPFGTSGTPEAWVPLSVRQVQQQPEEETSVYVVSTSASDTANATVEYTRIGGYVGTATVTLTGNTAVQVGTDTDIVAVNKFFLTANAAGTVTLATANSGGTVLATIPKGAAYARYIGIQLYPTPAANATLHVDFTRNIPNMSDDWDEPLLPEDFHYLLSVGARIDEYEKLDDDRKMALIPEWRQGVQHLVTYVINNPDYIVVPGGQVSERSSLGPWYPAGS